MFAFYFFFVIWYAQIRGVDARELGAHGHGKNRSRDVAQYINNTTMECKIITGMPL